MDMNLSHGDGVLFDMILQETNPEYVSLEMEILRRLFPEGDPCFTQYAYERSRKGVVNNMSGGTLIENDVALGTGQLDLPAIIKAKLEALKNTNDTNTLTYAEIDVITQ